MESLRTPTTPRHLHGRHVVDREGDDLGVIEDVYLDPATSTPEWALVRRGRLRRHAAVVPLAEASFENGSLRLPVERRVVERAPAVHRARDLEPELATRLHDYYSVPHAEPTGEGVRARPIPERVPAAAVERERVRTPRAGFSLPAVASGAVLMLGAAMVLGAGAAGLLGLADVTDGGLTRTEAIWIGLAAAAGLVVAGFFAAVWSGYCAGRMARGAAAANGLLVGLLSLAVMAAVGLLVNATQPDVIFSTTVPVEDFPLGETTLQWFGVGFGVVSAAAILFGAMAGSRLGVRRHAIVVDRTPDTADLH